MVLPNDLISKFVKITRDDKKTKTETTVYGTVVESVVESDGSKYARVRLDGAEENQLTPAIMTVDAEDGERVSVLIKDHTATVTGNISSPAARIETVNVITDTVEAQNAKITKIETDNVTINNTLTAHKASMEEIEADNVEINEKLTAANADIKELKTDKLSVKDADLKYANIDFANIGEAAIEKLFSDSGIIGDLVMSDGHVTGKLVGVTIIGDLIEGGTVKADKLVILGTDGLYYKLNTNGVTTTAEQTEYNSLSGKIITAKSITAEKINVDDLVAFGATIGGFHITKNSLYSGVKNSVDNTARGIYQDTDGQFAIGDANNFVKFYKDTDGTYKLAISANSITFGDSGKSVEEAIDEIKVGGRNLLKCTENLPISETINSSNGISKYESTLGTLETTDAGIKLIFDEQFNTSISVPLAYDGCVESDEVLTLSFAYRGNIDTFGQMYFLQRIAPNVSISRAIFPAMVSSETEWQHYEVTFSATNANARTSYQVLLFAGNTIYNSSNWIEIKAGSLKLEKGNKATDWTPAPEDVKGAIDDVKKVTITNVDVMYALHTSNSTAPTSGWSTTAPVWTSGTYMWQKTVTTYGDGTSSESAVTCISGAIGATGTGIASITEEYYLSTSKTTQTGGSWNTTAPAWNPGKYVWSRSKIEYSNPASTTYTTPICDSSWEAVNEVKIGGTNMIQHTDTSKYGTEYWTAWGSAAIEITSDYYVKVTNVDSANVFGAFGSPRSANVIKGREYTISFDGYADSEINLSYCYLMGLDGNLSLFGLGISPTLSTESKKISFTFSAPSDVTCSIMLGASNVADYAGSFYFKNLKLEEGNKATSWAPAPEDVESEIDDASKTAKNFLEFDAVDGLQIGNKTSGAWKGFRTQITNAVFRILDSTGTVLASYGEKIIELGRNATDAVIKFCGGKGQIEYVTDEDDNIDYIQMSSDKVRIKSSEKSSVYSMYTDNSTRWEKSAVNVSPKKVELYASECIDPGAPDNVDSWRTTKVTLNSGNVNVDTPGATIFNGTGVYDSYGKLMSVTRGSSGIWTYSKWSDGTVDLWGTYYVYDQACTNVLGSMYRTHVFQPDDFPFLVYNPQLVASYETSGYGAMLWATTTTTVSSPPSYYLIRPVSGTITYGKIIFHVTGTWV